MNRGESPDGAAVMLTVAVPPVVPVSQTSMAKSARAPGRTPALSLLGWMDRHTRAAAAGVVGCGAGLLEDGFVAVGPGFGLVGAGPGPGLWLGRGELGVVSVGLGVPLDAGVEVGLDAGVADVLGAGLADPGAGVAPLVVGAGDVGSAATAVADVEAGWGVGVPVGRARVATGFGDGVAAGLAAVEGVLTPGAADGVRWDTAVVRAAHGSVTPA